jgi:hypothetical protein
MVLANVAILLHVAAVEAWRMNQTGSGPDLDWKPLAGAYGKRDSGCADIKQLS